MSDDNFFQEVRNHIIQHLQILKNCFRDYFPLPNANNKWINDPFNVDVKGASEGNSFAELSCDTSRSSFIQYN
jgi:hypothetical protein